MLGHADWLLLGKQLVHQIIDNILINNDTDHSTQLYLIVCWLAKERPVQQEQKITGFPYKAGF